MIKVLHKAFDILENMSAHKDRVFSLTELAEMIGEKPTTCANIVKTLCDRGYLCRAEPRGYALGPVAQDPRNSDPAPRARGAGSELRGSCRHEAG